MIANAPRWLARLSGLRKYVFGAVMLGCWLYLETATPDLNFRLIPGGLWPMLLAVACVAVPMAVGAFDIPMPLPRRGVSPVPIKGGFGWGEALTSQLAASLIMLLFAVGVAWLSTGILSMAFQAANRADWGRMIVAGLIVLVVIAGPCWLFVSLALSRGPIMVVDGEGLHTYDEILPWSDIARIETPADPAERYVRLHLRDTDESRLFSLASAALSAAAFLEKVRIVAPQVEIAQLDSAAT